MNIRLDVHNSELPVLCQACEARHKGICGALEPRQLVTLSKTASKHRVQAGGELVRDAEAIESYSNILSGVVKLTKILSDGRQQIVGLQFAPDFLGRPFKKESDLNVEATTDVSLCSFPRATLDRLIRESPGLENRLLRQALEQLDEARDWMVTLGRKTAAEKVASFLLLIARNMDPFAKGGGARTFELPLSRADIADFLGLTVETVSRQLSKLRTAGVIRIEQRRHIVVDNIARLEARSGS